MQPPQIAIRLGQRLKYARTYLALTQEQVSRQTGIGESSLSEFESDKREPSFAQLNQLAMLYQKDVDFFLDDSPFPEEIVLWREKPAVDLANQTEACLLTLAKHYQRLEQLCGDPRPCNLDQTKRPAEAFNQVTACALAHEFRKKHSLGERPASSLMSVLEEYCRVKIFHLDFEPTGTAACAWHDSFGAAILLNAKNIRWRRNFDLAHELFHLLTWNSFRRRDALRETTLAEEQLANQFASCLLMPTEPLELAIHFQANETNELDYDDLFEIARQFDVSVPALIWRMVDLDFVDRDQAKQINESISGRVRFWDGRQNEIPRQRPVRYEALAIEAIRKGLISTGKFAQFMGISRAAAMTQVEQELSVVKEGDDRAKIRLADS